MRGSPVNKFFREIKRLEKTRDKYSNTDEGYWPFNNDSEVAPEDCFKREDGLWQKKEKINTHCSDGGSTIVFLWRVEPNYSCRGRPVMSHERVKQFLKNSETEKVLLSYKGYDFVWMWDTVYLPTETRWGICKGSCFYELRKCGMALFRAYDKKTFRDHSTWYLNELRGD